MEDEKSTIKRTIRISVIVTIVVLTLAIIALLLLKYEIEGETNMPFDVSKVMVISSAEGVHKDENTSEWDMKLMQHNDVYITINKNNNYRKTEIIDKIVFDNFVINEEPQVGEIVLYKPSDSKTTTYTYSDEFIVNESLEYIGNSQTNLKDLEIGNQGGMLLFRIANNTKEEYTSSKDKEIIHDGTLLSKADLEYEQIKFKISFDVTIILKSEKSFKGTITLELPVGDVIQDGTASYEKTDYSDIIFKRM